MSIKRGLDRNLDYIFPLVIRTKVRFSVETVLLLLILMKDLKRGRDFDVESMLGSSTWWLLNDIIVVR